MRDYSGQKIRQDVNTSNVSFTGQQYDSAGYAEVHSTVALQDHPQPIKVDTCSNAKSPGLAAAQAEMNDRHRRPELDCRSPADHDAATKTEEVYRCHRISSAAFYK
jgi:hypothetical protein